MLCFTLNALHLSFAPPKLLLSQPAAQKAAARIAIGTLTVAQHKQRISAASLKVSSAILCLAAARPAPARLTRHSDAGSSAEEALHFKAELIKCRSKQMKQSIKGQQDCFTVSFNDNVI